MLSQSMLLVGRAVKEPAVHTSAALASVPATVAGLHAVGVSTTLNIDMLAPGLVSPGLWLTLGMTALFGGLGGIVAELLSLHGNIELPHRVKRGREAKRSRFADPRHEIDLGIVSRLLLGATAGLALLSVYAPDSPTALLTNALIAGSAAAGLFRLVQGRMLGKTKPSAVSGQLSAAGEQTKPTKLAVVRDTPSAAAH
jgi:hypothetical protein